jgi:F-type H+-transporting ATPase subunit delta
MKRNPEANENSQERRADVTAQRVARVYAEALLNAAQKKGAVDAVIGEFESLIHDVFKQEPKLEVLLSSAAVGRRRRADIIRKIFEGKAGDIFFNFLLALNSHERLELLRPILVELRELHDQRAGRVRVQVSSAVPLPDDQTQQLEQQLRDALRREPILNLHVDPELIAGVRIRVGDWQYDGSLLNRLANIKNQILTGTSHEIQSRRDRFSD